MMYTSRSKLLIVLVLFFLFENIVIAQQIIKLDNPSFEDIPRHSKEPKGWFDCGSHNESPADVQPGFFGVNSEAAEGETYLGMVVRDNGTWEAVGQRMNAPLQADQCYDFSLFLARSDRYISLSRTTDQEANYTTPVKIRIWGGSSFCTTNEILAESSLIEHVDWLKYNFRFQIKNPITHLVIEACYEDIRLADYNGNVLIDAASDIVAVDCDSTYSNMIDIDSKIAYQPMNRTNRSTYTSSNPNLSPPSKPTKPQKKAPSDVQIKNTSFEKTNLNKDAKNWEPCLMFGYLYNTQTEKKAEDKKAAAEGERYVCLRTNDKGQKGSIFQAMDALLYPGSCYQFSFQASRSALYTASSSYLDESTNYDEPVMLRIWGSQRACGHSELLAETPLIEHLDWQTYDFIIQPKEHLYMISIEAARRTDVLFYYNGNVLVDDVSDFKLVSCRQKKDLFKPKEDIASDTTSSSEYRWQSQNIMLRNPITKSFTFQGNLSNLNLTKNLSDILQRAFGNYIIQFNIVASTKSAAKEQKKLLETELRSLQYPSKWYKIKISK